MIEQSRFIQAACQARRVYFRCSEVALEIFIVSTKSLGSFGMTVVEINPGLKPGPVFESSLRAGGRDSPPSPRDAAGSHFSRRFPSLLSSCHSHSEDVKGPKKRLFRHKGETFEVKCAEGILQNSRVRQGHEWNLPLETEAGGARAVLGWALPSAPSPAQQGWQRSWQQGQPLLAFPSASNAVGLVSPCPSLEGGRISLLRKVRPSLLVPQLWHLLPFTRVQTNSQLLLSAQTLLMSWLFLLTRPGLAHPAWLQRGSKGWPSSSTFPWCCWTMKGFQGTNFFSVAFHDRVPLLYINCGL